mmetsp:Transcript_20521/g.69558  ORF Transcript_20521/g.69558 Transcript_20521/m.69558 type:complete len:299 (-) Transcript_20521:684-1580(-)
MVCRASVTRRAVCSSGTTLNASPATGMCSIPDCQPTTCTARDGPAVSSCWPFSSSSERTRPHAAPATKMSPTLSVPRWISVVATTPRPCLMFDSTTAPDASALGFALSSSSSACSVSASRSSVSPVRSLAETRQNIVSPPSFSETRSYAVSSVSTRAASAPGASILLMTTTTGTRAAFAHAIESTVCCLTPSSAATTRITMSVTLAPRSRISANAACPGVSINVTGPLGVGTLYAPMACVMPPCSPAATRVDRSASRSDVLPWSTWPMIVTTGARGMRSASSSKTWSEPRSMADSSYS